MIKYTTVNGWHNVPFRLVFYRRSFHSTVSGGTWQGVACTLLMGYKRRTLFLGRKVAHD